jgi:hypothetical protein
MPITVMESLSLGCAVVASRVSGVEDYEHHPLADGCFWVHSVGDVAAATAAVQRASELDPAYRTTRARALATAEFSVERSVERYQALMRQLVASRSLTPNLIDRHSAVRGLISMSVAAQRVARLWGRGRYRRPPRVVVQ